MHRTFPPGFVWGSATSAYQVEGAWDADGKVPSIWDTALHEGTIVIPDGTGGDVAIDQYRRFDDDFDLLCELHPGGAHRFSTSWPRIVVDAAGTVNPAGIDHYDRVVDALLARDLAPALCLFHWDTPQWLEDGGGMLSRDFAHRFAEYAALLGARLGDRVAQWFTVNEPVNPTLGGYLAGALPPHHRGDVRDGLIAGHHLLLAHGQAIQALRATGVAGEIGTVVSIGGVAPATDHPDDVRAAERAEYFETRLFLDPMLGRGHLPEVADVLGDAVRDGDEQTIAQPMDVVGLNWYAQYAAAAPHRAAAHLRGVPERGRMVFGLAAATAPLGFSIVPTPGARWGGAHRQITPGGFRRALDRFAATYPDHPDIVITENGIGSSDDLPGADGTVDDADRIEYLSWALPELAEAIADGARVRGYHAWSSFDNFQWGAGFTHRFGMIHVDPETLERTPKRSFSWFGQLARTGVVPAATAPRRSGDHLGLDVDGVRNLRGVGGLRLVDGGTVRDGVLLRSAGLHRVGDSGRDQLVAAGVRTVIDLRGAAEIAAAPDPDLGARWVHLPLHDPGEHAATAPLPELYREIVELRGELIVAGVREILAVEDGATLVHCTAGKDRTGVFVAVVLSAAGVCDEDVLSSFAESAARLGDGFVDEIRAQWNGVTIPAEMAAHLLASPPEYLADVLGLIRRDHGSAAAYLLAHGLTEGELDALEARIRA